MLGATVKNWVAAGICTSVCYVTLQMNFMLWSLEANSGVGGWPDMGVKKWDTVDHFHALAVFCHLVRIWGDFEQPASNNNVWMQKTYIFCIRDGLLICHGIGMQRSLWWENTFCITSGPGRGRQISYKNSFVFPTTEYLLWLSHLQN